jgi:3-methylcrotonyl-CoA carboxylase beta subunit
MLTTSRNLCKHCKHFSHHHHQTFTHTFKTLVGSTTSLPAAIATNTSANLQQNQHLVTTLQDKQTFAALGGGEKSIQRHTVKNGKLLVRRRIQLLCDDNSDFFELSSLCGLDLYNTNVQSGGAVCGIGRISGRDVMIIASDATVSAGAMYPITVRKQLRAQEIAQENKLPVFYIVDSAGAFLPMQAEIFPDKEHGGRAFYNQAQMSALGIPQIAIVPGSCTAGGAYMCTMSDEAVIVKDLGFVYLGGPPLVKAATGEIVTDSELGGAEVHCELSGCTDHFAHDELDAIDIGRSIADTLPEWEQEQEQEQELNLGDRAPLHSIQDILELIPSASERGSTGTTVPLPIHHVLARVLDKSQFHEHRANYGKTLVCGIGRIGGNKVGIVANQGPLMGGTADKERAMEEVKVGASSCPAALKGAHFISICNQRRIPLVYMTDIWEEELVQVKRGHAGAVADLGKMMAAVATSTVPSITLHVGQVNGSTAYSMGGRAMGSNFVFAWPNATMMGGGGEDTRDSFYAASRMWNDGVIDPRETRNVLNEAVRIAKRQFE